MSSAAGMCISDFLPHVTNPALAGQARIVVHGRRGASTCTGRGSVRGPIRASALTPRCPEYCDKTNPSRSSPDSGSRQTRGIDVHRSGQRSGSDPGFCSHPRGVQNTVTNPTLACKPGYQRVSLKTPSSKPRPRRIGLSLEKINPRHPKLGLPQKISARSARKKSGF